jgi:transcriptional regulator of acetoin/glycerol metabolism
MNEQHTDLIDRARGLASAKALIECATDDLLVDAVTFGGDISAIASLLGTHRSTVYRRTQVSSVRAIRRAR